MTIPFIDLKTQQKRLEPQLREAMDRVLAHGQYIMGPEIKALEEELARWAGTRHAVAAASGTDALLMPLLALGVGPGDAVFTSPFTFIATAEVIALLGATPVFVDIDPATYNISPALLAEAVDRVAREGMLKPRIIIPVDLFGLPADYDPVMALAKEKGLFVLEDAAQSFGARYKDRRAGGLGHAGGASFFPAKPLGAYGDGGAITLDDDDLYQKLVSIRVHGQGRDKYENVRVGINGRLDTLQAAILLVKLSVFEEEIQARQKVAARYSAGLGDRFQTPVIPDGYLSTWAQYSIQTDDRDRVLASLKEAGIPTAVYYPIPLHLQKAFAFLNIPKGAFPASEWAAQRIFSLPMHPYLDEETIDRIVAACRAAV